jgi:hypothetical protein
MKKFIDFISDKNDLVWNIYYITVDEQSLSPIKPTEVVEYNFRKNTKTICVV